MDRQSTKLAENWHGCACATAQSRSTGPANALLAKRPCLHRGD
ncbi:MAG: hypothetical protein ACKOOL_02400 [Novosphingobium sp.]